MDGEAGGSDKEEGGGGEAGGSVKKEVGGRRGRRSASSGANTGVTYRCLSPLASAPSLSAHMLVQWRAFPGEAWMHAVAVP
jgi:hypothetical protein